MAVTEADIPKIAKRSAAIYRQWSPLIDRYHGGVPDAMVAVRMKIESNGTMDMEMGSDTAIGVLSVTEAQEDRFGVRRGTRLSREGNVFLACLRYNVDTYLFLKRYPGLAKDFADAYIFGGQLISAIGVGAADYLFDRAPRNLTYKQFADWVSAKALAKELPITGPWGCSKKTGKCVKLPLIVYRVRAMEYMNRSGDLMQSKYGVSNVAGEPAVPPLPMSIKSIILPRGAENIRRLTGGEKPFIPGRGDVAIFQPKSKSSKGWIPIVFSATSGAASGALAILIARRAA